MPSFIRKGTEKGGSVANSHSSYGCITPGGGGNRAPAAASGLCQEWRCHGFGLVWFGFEPRQIMSVPFLPEPGFPSQAPSRGLSYNLMITGCFFAVYPRRVNSSSTCCKQEILRGRIGATANLYCLGSKVLSTLLTPHTPLF